MPSLTSIASGPISVSSLLEVVADDLHKLNTNLKSVSSLINSMVFSLLISTGLAVLLFLLLSSCIGILR